MTDALKAELDIIAEQAKAAGEPLTKERVYGFASANKDSQLHQKIFEKSDEEAIEAYRLSVCGALIRTYIKLLPQVNKEVRAFIHVPSDDAGYRRVEDVSANPFWRGEVVNGALSKISRVRDSYAYLPELDPFFARLDALIADFRLEMVTERKTG